MQLEDWSSLMTTTGKVEDACMPNKSRKFMIYPLDKEFTHCLCIMSTNLTRRICALHTVKFK